MYKGEFEDGASQLIKSGNFKDVKKNQQHKKTTKTRTDVKSTERHKNVFLSTTKYEDD